MVVPTQWVLADLDAIGTENQGLHHMVTTIRTVVPGTSSMTRKQRILQPAVT